MKKIILSWIAILCMALTLAGCGAQPDLPKETAPAEITLKEAQVEEVGADELIIADLGDGKCELAGCTSEGKRIRIPETLDGLTLVRIATYAFNNVPAEEIILPDTVEEIGNYAFNGCENLKEVSLGTGLKVTGQMIFNFCNALQSVTFPEGMTTMSYLVFGTCNELREAYIPASVTEIPNGITYTSMCPNITIVTPAGSVAEQTALENQLPVREA